MNRRIILVVGFVLLIFAGRAQAQTNLITNPGFENDSNQDDIPDNWGVFQWGDRKVMAVTRDPEVKHNGNYSVKLSTPEVIRGQIAQNVPVEGGKTYDFSVWAKSKDFQGKGECGAILFRYSSQQKFIDLPVLRGTRNWMVFSKRLTMPENADSMNIMLSIYHAKGTVWFDEVSLVEVGSKEKISNGSFEEATADGKSPRAWYHSDPEKMAVSGTTGVTFFAQAGPQAKEGGIYTWEEEGHRGKKCISADERKDRKWGEWNTLLTGIQPNTNYLLTLWAKTDKKAKGWGAPQVLIFGKYYGISCTTNWTKYSNVVNSGSNSGKCILGLLNEGAAYRFWFDDISLIEHRGRTGTLLVKLGKKKSSLSLAEATTIASQKGKRAPSYTELSKVRKEAIQNMVKMPPISEIDSPFSTMDWAKPWNAWYSGRPSIRSTSETGGDIQVMHAGQKKVQAQYKTKKRLINCNLLGKPDIDIIVRNKTTGEKYKYKEKPTAKNEYWVNQKIGQFHFGAPQNAGDRIEFTYRFKCLSPYDESLTVDEITGIFIKDALDLGVKHFRITVDIATGSNPDQLNRLERYVNKWKEKGFEVGFYVGGKDTRRPLKGADLEHHLQCYRNLAQRFKGRIYEYTISGELDREYEFPVEAYVKMLGEISKVIREEDPQTKVISASLTNMNVGWCKAMLDEGAAKYIDFVGIDPYQYHTITGHPEAALRIKIMKKVRYKWDHPANEFPYTGEFAKFLEDSFDPLDIHGWEKQFGYLLDFIRSYKPTLGLDIPETGYNAGLPNIRVAEPPATSKERLQYSKVLMLDDTLTPQQNYNKAIRNFRQYILMAETKLGGKFTQNCLHQHWKYPYAIINEWGERTLSYYAYQTLNHLLYNYYQLQRPEYSTNLAKIMHTYIYCRDKRELIILLWTPYEDALVNLVLDDTSYEYPVRVALFDYKNLLSLESEIIKGCRIIKGLELTQEPFIIRLVREK